MTDANMSSVKGLVMPFSNVGYLAFPDKIKATRLAGFDQMSVMPFEVKKCLAGGTSIPEMLAIAAHDGVRISRLDPLSTWPRIWRPDNMSEEHIATVSDTPDEFFRMADAFGCTHMSLNATFPAGSMSMDEIVEHYAAICRAAAEHGMICALEFIPAWGVPDLATAWHIVSSAGAPNGGIVFDVLHFVRSHSSVDLLAQIPGSLIHCVQLNDGPLVMPAGMTLQACIFERLFPGDGEFPVVEIVRVLASTGGLNQVGPEVFNPFLAEMRAAEIAQKSRQSLMGILAKAGIAIANL